MVCVLSCWVQSNFNKNHPILREKEGAKCDLEKQSQELHEVHKVDFLDDEAIVRHLIILLTRIIESTFLLILNIILDP